MNIKNLVKNIKGLIVFFSICFLGIMVYLTYFMIYKSQWVVKDVTNPRIRAEEESIIRGSILDRKGKKIVYNEVQKNGKQKRIYINGQMFAHVIGYSSYIYGKTGIEQGYDDILLGKSLNSDVLGVIFRSLKENINGSPKRGYNLQLTIDADVQRTAYNMLGQDKGAVVAVNPKTGEIIALVSRPSFDPQNIDVLFDKYNNDTLGTPFFNRASEGYYPPGSVFKIVTASAALEDLPDIRKEVFNCTGGIKFKDYILRDHGGTAHGKLNIEGAFSVSCNSAFGNIGMKLGYEKLKDMAEAFTFNQEIEMAEDIQSLNIKTGQIKIDNPKYPSLVAQDAIGQHGVSSNPLQMALVVSAIANDGIIMKPFLVAQIRDAYGNIIESTKPEKLANPIKKETAQEIKKYMLQTVKNGTGREARIPAINIGGKTGSAENQQGEETHSWFVALGPTESPEIVVAVIVENAGRGGGRAAEIAREVIKVYLKK